MFSTLNIPDSYGKGTHMGFVINYISINDLLLDLSDIFAVTRFYLQGQDIKYITLKERDRYCYSDQDNIYLSPR